MVSLKWNQEGEREKQGIETNGKGLQVRTSTLQNREPPMRGLE